MGSDSTSELLSTPVASDTPETAGFWTACRTCCEVCWQEYGKSILSDHRCRGVNQDEGDLERAEEEADFLNELEEVRRPYVQIDEDDLP